MNLPTEFSPSEKAPNTQPVIQLDGVSVDYRAPREQIPSFKEYAIRWFRGEIRYHKFTALRKISLEVRPGEILGIIGPNGAGKSTLLKVIARVLRPTEGRVRIRGRVSPLLELGAGFDRELTGRENVYLNSAILGFSRHEVAQRFNRIVEFAGLQDFIDAPVRTYSTGMAARLGFAVATDVQPEILIVDEILGVGDVEFQRKSFERIQSFQAAGSTILLVTHSLQKVREMCSRVIWLEQGNLMIEGDAEQVVAQYMEKNKQLEAVRLQQKQDEANRLRQERQKKKEAPQRWGTRQVEITNVAIQNAVGEAQTIFQTGQPFCLKIDYQAHEPIPDAVFGMAIYRNDGVHITGPNTQVAGLHLPTLEGAGTVYYCLNRLPLLNGLYQVTVAVLNRADTEMYDHHNRLYTFRVENSEDETVERYGLAALGGEWRLAEPENP